VNLPEFHDVALVTGAGRGLGAVIARSLAAAGYRVAVSDLDTARATAVADAINNAGNNAGNVAISLPLDVTDHGAFAGALSTICAHWGGLGVLVNNAALTKTTAIFDISPEEFSTVTTVNLRGTFLGCQVFGRYFAEQGYGRIINLASLAAQNGGAATGAHYAASKGGIITLTKLFARELAARGVTVNAIAPGPLDVELVHDILSPEKLASVVASIPVGTLGDPAFIAEVVKLMASPGAGSMTGTTIDANGGLYVR
jgi:3-oxoacyl-[acyl-carrier protein] reductase